MSQRKEAKFIRADKLFKNAKPTNIARDVQKEIEVMNLLGTYSVDYILETFDYVINRYGYTESQLREMAPKAIAEREYQRRRIAGIAEIMPYVVGGEPEQELLS